ncbi:MAG: hypothetical protein VKJ87_00985 [Synechococcus sp.]|nr:hypothetical protein [Synechococcus sp.]
MSIHDSRAGASQAILNSQAASWFATEAAVIGIGYGIYKQSWLAGLIAFFIFAVIIYIPIINYLFATAMTATWGYATWKIAGYFDNNEMTIVLTILATAISASIHFYSIHYYNDLNKSD